MLPKGTDKAPLGKVAWTMGFYASTRTSKAEHSKGLSQDLVPGLSNWGCLPGASTFDVSLRTAYSEGLPISHMPSKPLRGLAVSFLFSSQSCNRHGL